MNTRQPARDLARDLCRRSPCQVQVAAVLVDRYGIFAWGWNHCGPDGMGEHAEAHAVRRANPRRVGGATLVVYGQRARNGRPVLARPCAACEQLLARAGIRRVEYHAKDNVWRSIAVSASPA